MDPDFILLKKFIEGDARAFKEIVNKYKNTVYDTAYSICGRHDEADDIAQEVFLKIYRNAGKFLGKSSFKTWLYRVTVNQAITNLRKKKSGLGVYDEEFTDNEKFKAEDFTVANDAGRWLQKEHIRETIQKALRMLPEKYRTVVVLKEIDGLSYNEIAEALNISVGRVKIRLFRAREKLKGLLLHEEVA